MARTQNNTVAAPIVINKAAVTRAANKAAAEQARIVEEQQAELARLRAEKKAKREEAIRAKAAALDAANEATRASIKPAFTPEQEAAAQQERIMNAASAFLGEFELPSWKRTLAATVISLLVAFGTGYVIGTIAAALLVGAVMITGAAWLGWVIYVLGIIAAGYFGAKTGGAAFSYIADKKVDAHVGAVRSTVGKWFGFGKDKVEAFAGNFTKVAA